METITIISYFLGKSGKVFKTTFTNLHLYYITILYFYNLLIINNINNNNSCK